MFILKSLSSFNADLGFQTSRSPSIQLDFLHQNLS